MRRIINLTYSAVFKTSYILLALAFGFVIAVHAHAATNTPVYDRSGFSYSTSGTSVIVSGLNETWSGDGTVNGSYKYTVSYYDGNHDADTAVAGNEYSECFNQTYSDGVPVDISETFSAPAGLYYNVRINSWDVPDCDDNTANIIEGVALDSGISFPDEYPDGYLSTIFTLTSGGGGGNNGFLGPTAPEDITNSLTAGVAATGTALWPLFVFVGIGIAFGIAWYLVEFTRQSIGSKTSKKSSGYEENYTPEQVRRITKKIEELGDRDTFS